ncbi:MAG: sigma-70 family RNA polymerase sigma factor [Deltaproteobacteria bacterium]|nr:sigma-70 family RNA polymerase sigma factor [Deltaproteobacteria bacterium]
MTKLRKEQARRAGQQSDSEHSLSDAELVRRAAQRDKEAFRLLVEKYQVRAFNIAFDLLKNREDAEDVVQESFVKAYLSLPEFEGRASFYTWLYRIVYNMAIDYKRKVANKMRQGSVAFDDLLHSEEQGSGTIGSYAGRNPHDELVRKEQAARFGQVMNEISDEHRAVIMFRELDGMNYEQIAEATGVSKGTIMSRLHYARKKLQKGLQDLVSEDVLPTGEEMPRPGGKAHKLIGGVL